MIGSGPNGMSSVRIDLRNTARLSRVVLPIGNDFSLMPNNLTELY